MCRVLLTAFEPYAEWSENSSWLTLIELTRDLPSHPRVTTRRYPVDYESMRTRLVNDLSQEFDFAVHLGQAPGSCAIRLETVAINQASDEDSHATRPLVTDGPVAYQSTLAADDYCSVLRESGFPAFVSRHAGTYLCNAALYFSLHTIAVENLTTQALFVHLPLDRTQAARQTRETPSLPVRDSAEAIRLILQQMTKANAKATS